MEHSSVRHKRLTIVIDEPVRARIILVRCIIGLAALALTAIIGLRAPIDDTDPALIAASVAAEPDTHVDASLAHRKHLYDMQRGRIKEAVAREEPAPIGNYLTR
jgi:hypothetical protein